MAITSSSRTGLSGCNWIKNSASTKQNDVSDLQGQVVVDIRLAAPDSHVQVGAQEDVFEHAVGNCKPNVTDKVDPNPFLSSHQMPLSLMDTELKHCLESNQFQVENPIASPGDNTACPSAQQPPGNS